MSCKHEWTRDCYNGPPSQVCGRCNAWRIEVEQEKLIRDAYRRGAEAMREAAAKLFDGTATVPGLAAMPPYAAAIRALPIPEDK